MGKTKPENPGLGGRLNLGFRFEKNQGYPGFRVRANPTRDLSFIIAFVTLYYTYSQEKNVDLSVPSSFVSSDFILCPLLSQAELVI